MGEDPKGKKDNIIIFPGLSKRVYELGINALNNKIYHEALKHFEDLQELDESLYNTSEVQIGIIISLLEMGQLQDAKQVCKRLLQEDIGDYFDILQIYASILIQLGEYEEVVDTLEAVLEESKFPPRHAEHLYQLLEFGRRHRNNKRSPQDSNSLEEKESIKKRLQLLLNERNQSIQLSIIQDLRNVQLSQYLDVVERILQSIDIHPFLKTLLLQMLLEQGVNQKIRITKFNKQIEINPSKLQEPLDQSFAVQVKRKLEDQLEPENPTLYDAAKQIWENYVITTYPLPLTPPDPSLWAAALHKIGYTFHGIEVEGEELSEKYEIDAQDLGEVIRKVNEVDSYSYL